MCSLVCSLTLRRSLTRFVRPLARPSVRLFSAGGRLRAASANMVDNNKLALPELLTPHPVAGLCTNHDDDADELHDESLGFPKVTHKLTQPSSSPAPLGQKKTVFTFHLAGLSTCAGATVSV